jgi:CheY-like chemotaxis protein
MGTPSEPTQAHLSARADRKCALQAPHLAYVSSLSFTGFASDASRAAALAAGAAGYLAKPFAASNLVSLVQGTLITRPQP